MKKIIGAFILSLCFLTPVVAHAETAEESNHTYTQPFQNVTTSLTGTAVKSTMYFTRIDYWTVEKATFNLTYQLTQLETEEQSDLTVAVNGVKFYSWRPENTTEKQNQTIEIPLELIQGSNVLTLEGQIINGEGTDSYKLVETPANWLTIYDGSNVNFQYDLQLPEESIHSFYNHFVGADTIANQQSSILVPTDANETELAAASYALMGMARIITTSENYLPINTFDDEEQRNKPYQLLIAEYDRLPKEYQSQITSDVDKQAVIQFFNSETQHVLVVTSKDQEQLLAAGCYLANQELMTQTEKSVKVIDSQTETFTSSLEFDGNIPLTSTGDKLTGSYHQEQVYFVSLPVDRNNADGSSLDLRIKYADNLDFENSLVTVYVNDIPIGSQKLTAEGVNGDEVRLIFPEGLEISDAFVIKVAFDLNVTNPEVLRNGKTPWALIENTSTVYMQTQEISDVLFANYPNVLITDQGLDNLGVVLPETLNSEYFKTLTNVLNLLGNYTQSNIGSIEYYRDVPKQKELSAHNLLILGTPTDNPLIKELNDKLYFQYDQNFETFLSNEKLSLETDYGKTIGTAQLLYSPFNSKAVALVVTGTTPETVYLASTQIKSQANTSIYQGDAIVVDTDYRRYDYRFKKNANAEENSPVAKILARKDAIIYGLTFVMMLTIIGTALYFILTKHANKGDERND